VLNAKSKNEHARIHSLKRLLPLKQKGTTIQSPKPAKHSNYIYIISVKERFIVKFIEIKMPKCTLFLKPEEITNLVMTHDQELFIEAVKRGKAILRARTLQERIERKRGI